MREIEKLDAGLPYDFYDDEVNARKLRALRLCKVLNSFGPGDNRKEAVVRELLGSAGNDVTILPCFNCDYGLNIHVGDEFLANYNVTILDIAPVRIGSHVMIAPNVVIATVNHPMTPAGRRAHLGIGAPVSIGDDVWIGTGAIVCPGVTIGNNVVVAAGAVVTKDVPDNSLVEGVPARINRTLVDDVER